MSLSQNAICPSCGECDWTNWNSYGDYHGSPKPTHQKRMCLNCKWTQIEKL